MLCMCSNDRDAVCPLRKVARRGAELLLALRGDPGVEDKPSPGSAVEGKVLSMSNTRLSLLDRNTSRKQAWEHVSVC